MRVLRPYQAEAVDSILEEWKNVQSTMICLATGCGKTEVFCDVIKKRLPGRAMVLVHREELVRQAVDRLQSFGIEAGIEMGKERVSHSSWKQESVIVSTIQTQISGNKGEGRMFKFKPHDFNTLILDEMHHAVSKSWMKTINFYRINPDLKVLGVSVGPASFIELKGGCFGSGFVGEIEKAFDIAAKTKCAYSKLGYEIIDLNNVFSRGWDGNSFKWKPCLKILRHTGKPCIKIKVQGSSLEVTPDHSIYKAVSKTNKIHKNTVEIQCKDASELTVGDILIGDDGKNFEESNGIEIDMIDFCTKNMPNSRVTVACDVKAIPRSTLRSMVGYKTVYAWRERGSIPIEFYKKISTPPAVKHLRVEGSTCTIAPKINLSDWAYILGFYLGDGWVSDKRIAFAVGLSQKDEILNHLKTLPGIFWNVSCRKMRGESVEIRGNNIFLANLILSIFGSVKCYEKFIPGEWILNWNQCQKESLLQGLMDSDGYTDNKRGNKNRNIIVTTSNLLANGICSLLRSLGKCGSIHTRKVSNGGVINGRHIIGKRVSYSVSWATSEKRGHYGKRKKYIHTDISFTEIPVRKISNSGTPEWVYDLEMDGHPSFVSDGILVHNTATPDRADEQALGQVIDTVAYDYEILDAINDGWLVPIQQQMVHVHSLDFSQMRTTAGDLNLGDLSNVMEAEKNLHEVVSSTIDIIGNKRTIVFAASVKQAEMYAEIFNRHRSGMASWVCGKTPKIDRAEKLRLFNAGEIQVMINCAVLTEGFDSPGVEVIVQARPTKSRSLYSQTVGRSTRPLPGIVDQFNTPEERKAAIAASSKKSALIIDFVGNAGRHRLMTTADILGGKSSDEVVDRAIARAKESGEAVNMTEIMEEEAEKLRREIEEKKRRDAARRANLKASAKFSIETVDPFSTLGIEPVRSRGWDEGKKLSQKEVDILLKYGIDPTSMSYAQGKQMVLQVFHRWKHNLASLKQCKKLQEYGYDTKNLKFTEASALLTQLAKNGWKRPSQPIATGLPITPLQSTPAMKMTGIPALDAFESESREIRAQREFDL